MFKFLLVGNTTIILNLIYFSFLKFYIEFDLTIQHTVNIYVN